MDLKTYARAQQDRVAAVVCVLLGAVVLLIGWIGVSGTALTHEQLSYIVSGGLFGIALVGIGATLWLSADLRDEWRKLDRVEEALLAVAQSPNDGDLLLEQEETPAPDVPSRRRQQRSAPTR